MVDGGQRKSGDLFALAGSPPCMAKINKGTLVNVQKNLIPINLPILACLHFASKKNI